MDQNLTSVPPPVPTPSAPPPNPAPPTAPTLVYASFGQRFLASLVDGFLVGIVNFVISFVFSLPVSFMGDQDTAAAFVMLSSLLGYFLSLAVNYGYFIYFTGKTGQTLGKKALGIKVLKLQTLQPPGYASAALRETVGKFVSAIVLGVGYLWVLKDEKKQAWHDKIATTIVVKS